MAKVIGIDLGTTNSCMAAMEGRGPTVIPTAAAARTTPAGAPFPQAAHRELGNAQLRANLGHATHTIRDKRLRVVAELPDWEDLREAGRAIKEHVMANLPARLAQCGAKYTPRGGVGPRGGDAGGGSATRGDARGGPPWRPPTPGLVCPWRAGKRPTGA